MRKTNFLLFLAILVWPVVISAHTVGLSKGAYVVVESGLDVELIFARSEIPTDIVKLLHSVEVQRGSAKCSGKLEKATDTGQDGLLVRATYRCFEKSGNISVNLHFLPFLSHGHRHVATAVSDQSRSEMVLYKGNSRFTIAGVEEQQLVWPLFRLGVEHILTGYDHLLFLLALILIGGSFRSLLVIVSSFTLAHSISLGLSALNLWKPNPGLVEPAIALSIAYIGAENWFIRNSERRWLITFPFGLIHGFGFAGALQEISVPAGQIPLALASFNLGVEAGQMLFISALLPVILWLRKKQWFSEIAVKALSSGVVVAGLCWFIARLG